MQSEIEKWFRSQNLPIDKIIDIGRDRHSLSKPAIQMAIESVYVDRIRSIPQLKIAWEVWKRARMFQSEQKDAEYIDKWDLMVKAMKDAKKDRIIYWSIIGFLVLIIVAMGVSDGRFNL